MKAAVIRKAGGRVEVEDRGRPTPGPDEVLIRRRRAVVVMQ